MKPYLKTVYNEITQQVDSSTGEVIDISSKQQKIVVETEQEFFFVYASVINALKDETIDAKILAFIMFKCINSDGEFSNNAALKEKITKALSISVATLNRTLKALNKADIIIKTHIRGTYQINPSYIWKGTTRTRKKRLELILENR